MSAEIAELKSKLAAIAEDSSKADMCFILEQMLDRKELRFEKHFESCRERFDCHFVAAECSLLDQIEDVPDDIQRAFLELLVQGKLKFSVADYRCLNLYWRITPKRLN